MTQARHIIKDASIQRLSEGDIDYVADRRDIAILLLGPTGAGKSRFIETLSGNETLGISKDQLEGVTQNVYTYRLDLMELWRGPGTEIVRYEQAPSDQKIYILDTPGSSDSQISEMEIIEMVNGWMEAHNDTPGSVSVVTTMWDKLWNERTTFSAERRFAQLRDDVWKDLVDAGGPITRALTEGRDLAFLARHTERFCDAPFGTLLYHDLTQRIQSARQEKHSLLIELCELEIETNRDRNHKLKVLLEGRLQNTQRLLAKFEIQLLNFGKVLVGFDLKKSK
ncbi:hypothetical protein BJ165DRAFT_1546860 [Panaeolus papilionaceus]|nr:hypothetical protein BJ165DRAFT_1546860 [Panaeolus papilionaceus]